MDRKASQHLMERLNRDAEVLSRYFGLCYRAIEAERPNVKRRYGICYSDGTIKIRLRHATTGQSLKYSSLVDTLCHELAHLRYFNHGERFQLFYRRILELARREGIYRPAPRRPARAVTAASPPDLLVPRSGRMPARPTRAANRTPVEPAAAKTPQRPSGPRQLALFERGLS